MDLSFFTFVSSFDVKMTSVPYGTFWRKSDPCRESEKKPAGVTFSGGNKGLMSLVVLGVWGLASFLGVFDKNSI